jgi:sugar lactone lactonase YvrE
MKTFPLLCCVVGSIAFVLATARRAAAEVSSAGDGGRPPFQLRRMTSRPFAKLGGSVYGSALGRDGRLYVVRDGREILRVDPDGSATPFYELDAANSTAATRIWSLRVGPDGCFYACGMDRVLRVTPEGRASTVLVDALQKIASVEFDARGQLYYVNGTQVRKFTPGAGSSLDIECGGQIGYVGLTDLKFDASGRNLYVTHFNDQELHRYPIAADGTVGPRQVILDARTLANRMGAARPGWYASAATVRPSWFVMDERGELFVSLEEIHSVLHLGTDGAMTIHEIDPAIFDSTLTFGRGAYGERTIYTPGFKDGVVHRLDFAPMAAALPER